MLVTFHLKDFPEHALVPHDVHAVSPDAFLLDQLDLHPAEVGHALLKQTREPNGHP